MEEDPQMTKVLVVVDGLAVLEQMKTPLVEQEDLISIPHMVVVEVISVVRHQLMAILL